jgi:hypothetical protein
MNKPKQRSPAARQGGSLPLLTTRGTPRQRVPKGFWETIRLGAVPLEQLDTLTAMKLRHTFSPKLAGEFIQLLPDQYRSEFKRKLIRGHSFWEVALKFLIQNKELAELQLPQQELPPRGQQLEQEPLGTSLPTGNHIVVGELILKLWLPDNIILLLTKALERLVRAAAKHRIVDLQQAEFIRALGEHYSNIQRGSG